MKAKIGASNVNKFILGSGGVARKVLFPGVIVEEPTADFAATFANQYPRSGEVYSSIVFYAEDQPEISWSFFFRGSMTASVNGAGFNVGDTATFTVDTYDGYTTVVDIFRRDATKTQFVQTLSGTFEYELSDGDIGFEMIAKQRLIGSEMQGTDGREVSFVSTVVDATPDAVFTGTLESWSGGTGRWSLSGTWSGSSSFDGQYIYANRSSGSSTFVTPVIDPPAGQTASSWLSSNGSAFASVVIGGTGTNKSFVTNIGNIFVVGQSTTGFVGFGADSLPGATAAEIADSGSWNWRPGDTITFGLIGI
jgi:hypothetical protein